MLMIVPPLSGYYSGCIGGWPLGFGGGPDLFGRLTVTFEFDWSLLQCNWLVAVACPGGFGPLPGLGGWLRMCLLWYYTII